MWARFLLCSHEFRNSKGYSLFYYYFPDWGECMAAATAHVWIKVLRICSTSRGGFQTNITGLLGISPWVRSFLILFNLPGLPFPGLYFRSEKLLSKLLRCMFWSWFFFCILSVKRGVTAVWRGWARLFHYYICIIPIFSDCCLTVLITLSLSEVRCPAGVRSLLAWIINRSDGLANCYSSTVCTVYEFASLKIARNEL